MSRLLVVLACIVVMATSVLAQGRDQVGTAIAELQVAVKSQDSKMLADVLAQDFRAEYISMKGGPVPIPVARDVYVEQTEEIWRGGGEFEIVVQNGHLAREIVAGMWMAADATVHVQFSAQDISFDQVATILVRQREDFPNRFQIVRWITYVD